MLRIQNYYRAVFCLCCLCYFVVCLSPLTSLRQGKWLKFISGASNQDLPFITNLCYLYTAAGVDCIDLSADTAVLQAAIEGINIATKENKATKRPFVMVSVNDGDDLHFRKAVFNPQLCPSDCPRPCEKVCPALAIPTITSHLSTIGVDASKCYGCGRCIPVCPLGLINAEPYQVSSNTINSLLSTGEIDAIEIHTQLTHPEKFHVLWSEIGEAVLQYTQMIAVSFPDIGENTINHLGRFQQTITTSSPALYQAYPGVQLWQTDGRPMSGDIGKGTAHAAVSLAHKLLLSDQRAILKKQHQIDFDSGKHFVQLAGGVNSYSPVLVKEQGLEQAKGFGGYAFGGYARKQLIQYFEKEQIDRIEQLQGHTFPGEFVNQVVQSVKQ